jgi:hypothetical protein
MLAEKDFKGGRFAKLLVPSIATLVWCAVLLSNQAPKLIGRRLSGDGDFAQHLTLGRLMLEQRAILKVDPTLYTVGPLPWYGHEWLTEVAFAFTEAQLGLSGPVLLVSALIASACALTLREAEDQTEAAWPALLAFGFAAPLLVAHLFIRPHVVSWFFAVLWQRRLNLWARGVIDWRRWLLFALPLMVLWCNLHGGFLLAFVLLALEGAALACSVAFGSAEARAPALRRAAQLGLGALLVLAVSGLNPFGFGLHWHLFEHLSRAELLHHVNEFKSPDFFVVDNKPLLVWIVLSFALAAASHGGAEAGQQRPLHARLLQLALLWMTLSSQRSGPFFALLTAPIVAQDLAAVLRSATRAPGAWGRIARAVSESSTRLAVQDRPRDGRLWGLVLFAILLMRAPAPALSSPSHPRRSRSPRFATSASMRRRFAGTCSTRTPGAAISRTSCTRLSAASSAAWRTTTAPSCSSSTGLSPTFSEAGNRCSPSIRSSTSCSSRIPRSPALSACIPAGEKFTEMSWP